MILLTTPYNPGDLDPGNTYPHAVIEEIRILPKERAMFVMLYYGERTGATIDTFTRGKIDPVIYRLADNRYSTPFSDMCGSCYPPSTDKLVYDCVCDTLYQKMIDAGLVAGTVVD